MCREQLNRPQTWGTFQSSDSIAKMENVAKGLQESYQALHTLQRCRDLREMEPQKINLPNLCFPEIMFEVFLADVHCELIE